ncbi:hypothetical protein GCM10028806_04470 [Spirosoma terrae]|uniref:Uncharacterized protein n=1 Tax=Spirosoma terrae TaxID=1968276 RepID=A0A6L9LG47_9BACT|nr:hypothetical protein [Spirosoma terrae]NDU98312.1 hypothetical protein [Spirosoma terrae]
MTTISNQSELQTDTYAMPRPSTSVSPGLTADKKKMLGISAAALLLGGSAWAVAKKIQEKGPEDPAPLDPVQNPNPTASLPDELDVAGKVLDTMPFDEAFKTAREEVGVGGVFSWHGRWYNTFEKEEWNGLSLDQRHEFLEMVTQEELPFKPYHQAVAINHSTDVASPPATVIEGHMNGQRVMGLDFNRDGVIDTLVMDGKDGYTYRVVDASGDDRLDTLLRYDSLNGELVEIEKLDDPFILGNDQFSQDLEESMSREIVDSILEPELVSEPTEALAVDEHHTVDDDNDTLGNSYDDDDTYNNHGDVQDMDE